MAKKQKKREYFRVYLLNRYHERMKLARDYLGNKCCKCGSIERLELDHIEPDKKSFTIGSFWNGSLETFWSEVKKCQLLCKECHIEKTLVDKGLVSAKLIHGTLGSYRYCKCDLCKTIHSNYMKDYYIKNPRDRRKKK